MIEIDLQESSCPPDEGKYLIDKESRTPLYLLAADVGTEAHWGPFRWKKDYSYNWPMAPALKGSVEDLQRKHYLQSIVSSDLSVSGGPVDPAFIYVGGVSLACIQASPGMMFDYGPYRYEYNGFQWNSTIIPGWDFILSSKSTTLHQNYSLRLATGVSLHGRIPTPSDLVVNENPFNGFSLENFYPPTGEGSTATFLFYRFEFKSGSWILSNAHEVEDFEKSRNESIESLLNKHQDIQKVQQELTEKEKNIGQLLDSLLKKLEEQDKEIQKVRQELTEKEKILMEKTTSYFYGPIFPDPTGVGLGSLWNVCSKVFLCVESPSGRAWTPLGLLEETDASLFTEGSLVYYHGKIATVRSGSFVLERERDMSNTKGLKEELQEDAVESAYRFAAKQYTKLAREPLTALLSSKLGADEKQAEQIQSFLSSELGMSFVATLLHFAMKIPGIPQDARTQRLTHELRLLGMSSAMDAAADLVMGPLRDFMVKAIQDPRISALPQLEAQKEVPIFGEKHDVENKEKQTLP
jgi:hypothetical protein